MKAPKSNQIRSIVEVASFIIVTLHTLTDLVVCVGPDIESISGIPQPMNNPILTPFGDDLYLFGNWFSREYETNSPFKMDQVWILDAVQKEWTSRTTSGESPEHLIGYCTAVIGDKMYLSGGRTSQSFTKLLFSFDLKTVTWAKVNQISPIPPSRHLHACLEWKGSLFVYGGSYNRGVRTDMWSFDIDRQMWSEVSFVNHHPEVARSNAQTYKGEIFLLGVAYDQDDNSFTQLWTLHVDERIWRNVANLRDIYPSRETPFVVMDAKIILLGTVSIDAWYFGQQQIIVLQKDSYSIEHTSELQDFYQPLPFPIDVPSVRFGSSLVVLDENVLVFGGRSSSIINDFWVFDTVTFMWVDSSLSRYPIVREYANLAVVTETEIAVFGGNIFEHIQQPINDLWIFETSHRKWILLHRESECQSYEESCAPILWRAAFAHYDKQLFVIGEYAVDYSKRDVLARKFSLGTKAWSAVQLPESFFQRVALFDMTGYLASQNKIYLYGGDFANKSRSEAVTILDLDMLVFETFKTNEPPPVIKAPSLFWMHNEFCISGTVDVGSYYDMAVWCLDTQSRTWIKHAESSTALIKDAILFSNTDYFGQLIRYGKNQYSEVVSWVYPYQDGKWNPSVSEDKFARPTYAMKAVRIGSQVYQIGGSDYTLLNSVYTYDLAKTWCDGIVEIEQESGDLDDGSGRYQYFPNTKCSWVFSKSTHIVVDRLNITHDATLVIESLGKCTGMIYTNQGFSSQYVISQDNKNETFWIPSGRFRVRFNVSLNADSADGFGMTYINCPAGALLVNRECLCPESHFINFLGHCIKCPPGSLDNGPNQSTCLRNSVNPLSFVESERIAATELRELTNSPPPIIYGAAFEHSGNIYVAGGATNLESDTAESRVPMDTIFVTTSAVHSIWTRVRVSGDIPTSRTQHSLINFEGRVFLLGGKTSTPDASVYELIMSSFHWVRRGALPFEFSGALCVVYMDAIFVYGGLKGNDSVSNLLMKYLPAHDSWETIKLDWPLPFVANPVGGLYAGSLFAFSGSDGQREINTIIKIPLDSPSLWVQSNMQIGECIECDDEKQKCNFGRQWAAAGVFGSELHIFGGMWQTGVWQDVMVISLVSMEVTYRENYLLKTMAFPISVPPPKYGAVSVVTNGQLMIIGGAAPPNVVGSDTWTWDSGLRLWADSSVAHVPIHRSEATMVRIDDVSFAIFGGSTMYMEETLLNDIWTFDTVSATWTQFFRESSEPDVPSPRAGAIGAFYDDSLILMGGRTYVTQVDDRIWKFDLGTKKWSVIPFQTRLTENQRPLYREGSMHTMIGNTHIIWGGQVLPGVRGYERYSSIFSAGLSTKEILDHPPQSQDPIRRKYSSLVVREDSTLLLYGGQTFDGNALDDLWTLDTKNWIWTPHAVKDTRQARPKISHGVANAFGNSTVFFGGRDGASQPIEGAWFLEGETNVMVPMLVQNTGIAYRAPSQHSSATFGDSIVFFGGKDRSALTNQVMGYRPGFCSYELPQVIESSMVARSFDDGSGDANYLKSRDCMWSAPNATHLSISFQLGVGDIIRISEYTSPSDASTPQRVLFESTSSTSQQVNLSGSIGYTVELLSHTNSDVSSTICPDCIGFKIVHAACPALATLDTGVGCVCPEDFYMSAQGDCQPCSASVSNAACPVVTSSSQDESSSTIVAISVSISVFIVVVASFVYARLHKNAMMQVKGMENKLYMHIHYKDLGFKELLGSGRFGEVYRGMWRGADVAIKKLYHDRMDAGMADAFTSEISMMVELRHPNIVLYMGACVELPNLCIVCELLTGTLYQLLHRKEVEISLRESLGFLCDIAKGMQYLHASSPAILHRDLKSLNLLLDDRGHVKVSDFGMTALQGHETKERSSGSLYWMAPEVISGDKFTAAADVYSFGIVMWEVLSRRDPYEEQENILAVAIQVVSERLRPTLDFPIDPSLRSVLTSCWDTEVCSRPSFSLVLYEINKIREALPTPETSTQKISPRPSSIPPQGDACVVAGKVLDITQLIDTSPQLAERAITIYHDIVRDEVWKFKATLVRVDVDCFLVLFSRPHDAAQFSTNIQLRLNEAEWPPSLLTLPQYQPNKLFNVRGVRVQIGIHYGPAEVKIGDGAIKSLGKVSDDATALCLLAQGGQILMSQYAYEILLLNSRSSNEAGFVVEEVAVKVPLGAQNSRIYQIAHSSLALRFGMEIRSGKELTLSIHNTPPHSDKFVKTSPEDTNCISSSEHPHMDPFAPSLPGLGVLPASTAPEHASQASKQYSIPGYVPAINQKSLVGKLRPKRSWEIHYGDLVVNDSTLGHGGFGIVTRGYYKGKAVAIKKMLRQTANDRSYMAFQTEATILRRLSHPNIVPFIGACLEPPNLAIIMELITPGSLKDVILDSSISISRENKYKILSGIIRAMKYLHSQSPPVLHRDLKSSNILVNKDFHPYLCDFGFARVKLQNQTMTKCGTAIYQAPELLAGKRYDEKADVYSFAIVAWEIYTRKLPHQDLDGMKVAFAVVNGARPPITSRADPTMISMIKQSWAQNPDERPSFANLEASFCGGG
eukprot:TRINITY_DN2530_c1_g1_i4.p1 TRINITY_DN2530_c1_g1~~TRINITY_DN2530_c1_g1_i4.p1  ORF type:complete len:2539 (+),score=349.69 TRINITY_DN2530_c1_g1_i4:56-7672(+)